MSLGGEGAGREWSGRLACRQADEWGSGIAGEANIRGARAGSSRPVARVWTNCEVRRCARMSKSKCHSSSSSSLRAALVYRDCCLGETWAVTSNSSFPCSKSSCLPHIVDRIIAFSFAFFVRHSGTYGWWCRPLVVLWRPPLLKSELWVMQVTNLCYKDASSKFNPVPVLLPEKQKGWTIFVTPRRKLQKATLAHENPSY